MDFDYSTVKYLVIILSFLILGYVIFLVYTDITNVRGELHKVKTRLFDTSNSLEELQKQLEYVSDTDSETSQKEHHVFDEILNDNFFSNSSDPETDSEDPVNINSFSFNIPFLSQNNESLPCIEEVTESNEVGHGLANDDSPQNFEQEIKFENSLSQCKGVLASGKNKGTQCSKDAMKDSDYCTKHNK